MRRKRIKHRAHAPEVPADPGLLRLDLAGWAGARQARVGRKDALLGRVEALRLALNGRSLEARVRGNRPLPYRVTVKLEGARILARCTCSGEVTGPCRHAVAALEALRFPTLSRGTGRQRTGRQSAGRGRIIQPGAPAPGYVIIGGAKRTRTRDERIAAAGSEERQACRHRSRRERAHVEPLDENGAPPRWHVSPRIEAPRQTVTLRGSDEHQRYGCTCDDAAENELQTCSHVERVKNWQTRQRAKDRRKVPAGMLSVWCCARVWADRVPASLGEIRIDSPDGRVPASLARYFDSEAWLQTSHDGRSPSSWARAACRAARNLARTRGWIWDLDPVVPARIRQAATDERLSERRVEAAEDKRAWDDVISRVRLRLHPYQEEGARFLARAGRAFLADDMGLGKTVQAVVAALLLRERAGLRRTLVVCPASLKHQWRQEIDKVCGERARVVDGPRSARLAEYKRWNDGFLILNYELILRDLEAIRRTAPGLVILDEAQRIKNWSTKTAKSVKQLRSPHAFVLTGTPLENRLLELHSLVEFLHRRAAGPRWRLLPFHAVTEPSGRVIAYEGLGVLRGRLREFFLRRERRTVQDQLPERTDNRFWTEMSPEQLQPYRKHAATAARVLSSAQPLRSQDVRALLRALTSMRILCNAYAQYAWDDHTAKRAAASRDTRALHSPKLEEFARVLDDLLDESDTKIVVFSQWERMLRLAHLVAREPLERRDLRAEVFHGGLGTRARVEMLDAFRLDPEFRVMFSTDAGGLGLNLQESASIVVNLEVPWNPAVLEQRIGRVHRIGQRRSVQVLHFVTRGAIEERVLQVVESKRALFDGLLVDGADEVVLDEPTASGWLERTRVLLGDTDAAEAGSSPSPEPRNPERTE
jgi:superfamily II DNA or RNA helicase